LALDPASSPADATGDTSGSQDDRACTDSADSTDTGKPQRGKPEVRKTSCKEAFGRLRQVCQTARQQQQRQQQRPPQQRRGQPESEPPATEVGDGNSAEQECPSSSSWRSSCSDDCSPGFDARRAVEALRPKAKAPFSAPIFSSDAMCGSSAPAPEQAVARALTAPIAIAAATAAGAPAAALMVPVPMGMSNPMVMPSSTCPGVMLAVPVGPMPGAPIPGGVAAMPSAQGMLLPAADASALPPGAPRACALMQGALAPTAPTPTQGPALPGVAAAVAPAPAIPVPPWQSAPGVIMPGDRIGPACAPGAGCACAVVPAPVAATAPVLLPGITQPMALAASGPCAAAPCTMVASAPATFPGMSVPGMSVPGVMMHGDATTCGAACAVVPAVAANPTVPAAAAMASLPPAGMLMASVQATCATVSPSAPCACAVIPGAMMGTAPALVPPQHSTSGFAGACSAMPCGVAVPPQTVPSCDLVPFSMPGADFEAQRGDCMPNDFACQPGMSGCGPADAPSYGFATAPAAHGCLGPSAAALPAPVAPGAMYAVPATMQSTMPSTMPGMMPASMPGFAADYASMPGMVAPGSAPAMCGTTMNDLTASVRAAIVPSTASAIMVPQDAHQCPLPLPLPRRLPPQEMLGPHVPHEEHQGQLFFGQLHQNHTESPLQALWEQVPRAYQPVVEPWATHDDTPTCDNELLMPFQFDDEDGADQQPERMAQRQAMQQRAQRQRRCKVALDDLGVVLPEGSNGHGTWTGGPKSPAFGFKHRFHYEATGMGQLSPDQREFTKQLFDGRLSVVTETEIHYRGRVEYVAQFTGGELSNADGVGFILSSKLPSTKNIQRITSVFANRTGRICVRANSEVVRSGVSLRPLQIGDLISVAVDIDQGVVQFTVWGVDNSPPSTAIFDFGNALERLRTRIPNVPKNRCGHFACVIKAAGVTVKLGS